MAKRWRKEPNEKGLAAIGQTMRGWQLRENGEVLATVAPIVVMYRVMGWYWYGFGKNTSTTPANTVEEAKEQVLRHIQGNDI